MITGIALKLWLMFFITSQRPRHAYAAVVRSQSYLSSPTTIAKAPVCASPVVGFFPNGPVFIVGDPRFAPAPALQKVLDEAAEACRRGAQGADKPCLGRVLVNPEAREIRFKCGINLREADNAGPSR